MAQAHVYKFGLPEDLDLASENLRNLRNRAEISAQFEKAAIACDNANRMYSKSVEQLRKCDARMNQISRRFARLVAPFRIGSSETTAIYPPSRGKPLLRLEPVSVEGLIARADAAMRKGHAAVEEFKGTKRTFKQQRRREFHRSLRASRKP